MSNQIINRTVFKTLEQWAPLHLAYDWDNVGLLIGSEKNQVKKIMVTLDVLESVVDEAIEKDVDLIIAHHPVLFGSFQEINFDTPKGRVINKLIKNDISVYASHTNLDVTTGGVNDILADVIGVKVKQNLVRFSQDELMKLVVYVPESHVNEVRTAISEAGAGYIGNYSHCTFQTEGQGTFKPLEGTSPYIGATDQLEFVKEVRIETVIQQSNANPIIQAMKVKHPYEEVAYDLIPLQNKGKEFGLGRIGILNNPMKLGQLAEHIKEVLDLSHVRVTGEMDREIKKVAILGGSGEKYINQARKMGADVLITGDMTFHTAQDADEMGLAVIDAGHYIEKVMKEVTKQYLIENLNHTPVEVIVSTTNTDPFQII